VDGARGGSTPRAAWAGLSLWWVAWLFVLEMGLVPGGAHADLCDLRGWGHLASFGLPCTAKGRVPS
jgi:hypothetical protein